MRKIVLFICGICWSMAVFSLTGQAYMERFSTFTIWYQQLPLHPGPDFLEFVKGSTPLSNKLREKWLYELARTKDWSIYDAYYQPSNDPNLACYEQIAKFNLGQDEEALKATELLWLTGESRPQACNTLFDLFIKHKGFKQEFITKRLAIALDKRNIQLTRYLLKLYTIPHLSEVDSITAIYQNPHSISKITKGPFNNDFYLYGLKRIVSINMDQAITIWQNIKNTDLLDEEHQQAFLSHVALYKAMRNNDDAAKWFAKIKPRYYTDILLDWEIRLALKKQDWEQVTKLINEAPNKDTPCWQYWLARSLEEQGKKAQAHAIYKPLAQNRHYYGFLASLRLHKKPHFDNENPTTDLSALKAYQPVIDQIKSFYMSKQIVQASRLLNDFISELPKEEASALVYWIDTELKWHGKSVFLSNTEILNNQLTLRFPLAYQKSVKRFSKQYQIPPELVYAIIRQESGFREDVSSSAGALGLMQVMPRTASVVCKADKIAYQNAQQLFVSHKNINIGIAYLRQLSKRFRNHPVLVAAAYNAGPTQVVYWLKNHPPKEIDIWIETLPWQETRNYLKNVMAFYVVYQYRLNQKPDLSHFLEQL